LPTKPPRNDDEFFGGHVHEEHGKDILNQKPNQKPPPFYPTVDGKPPKTPQEKPSKKYQKEDGNKKDSGNNIFTPSGPGQHPHPSQDTKFDFNNYHDLPPSAVQNNNNQNQHNLGPGFYNPDTKYGDINPYEQSGLHPGIKQQQQIPPELLNFLPPNTQNLPPHLRIEQLLQHIQSQDNNNQGPQLHGQNVNLPFAPVQPNGINYNQFGESPPAMGNRPTGSLYFFLLLFMPAMKERSFIYNF
jgi:hypothetical protein